MTKYNITEKKEKVAAYRSLVSPKLMDELEGENPRHNPYPKEIQR